MLGEAGVQAGTRSISSCREQELRKEEKMKTRYRAQLENVQKGQEAGVLSDAEPDTGPAGHLPSLCPGWCHHSAGGPLVSADSV